MFYANSLSHFFFSVLPELVYGRRTTVQHRWPREYRMAQEKLRHSRFHQGPEQEVVLFSAVLPDKTPVTVGTRNVQRTAVPEPRKVFSLLRSRGNAKPDNGITVRFTTFPFLQLMYLTIELYKLSSGMHCWIQFCERRRSDGV